MAAESLKSLVKRRAAKSAPRLGQDVACRSLTPDDNVSFDKNELITVLLAMIQGLSYNVMNQDVWALSMFAARKIAAEAGVSEESFMLIQAKIFELQQAGKNTNPMKDMF